DVAHAVRDEDVGSSDGQSGDTPAGAEVDLYQDGAPPGAVCGQGVGDVPIPGHGQRGERAGQVVGALNGERCGVDPQQAPALLRAGLSLQAVEAPALAAGPGGDDEDLRHAAHGRPAKHGAGSGVQGQDGAGPGEAAFGETSHTTGGQAGRRAAGDAVPEADVD